MKNKLLAVWQNVKQRVVRAFRHFTDEQLGTRLLSLLLAVIMWAAVVSGDTTSRFITVSDLPVEVLGEDTLTENELAIKQSLRDLTQKNVTVRLEGSKTVLSALNKNNLRVVADLSKITTTGEDQTIALTVRNSGGASVSRITPYDAITVDVESLYSREVPVVVETVGDPRENVVIPTENIAVSPAVITVTGTESDVTSICEARVRLDLSDLTENVRMQQELALLDRDGNELFASVQLSSPTAIVSCPVYQTKTVPVEWRGSALGEVAEGYELTDADVFPAELVIAGYPADLARIDKVFVTSIDIEGVSQSFTQQVSFVGQTGVRWTNYESAEVTVHIREKQETVIVSEVPFEIVNVPEGASVRCENDTVTVAVSGPVSYMNKLTRGSFKAQVDMISAFYGDNPMEVSFIVTDENAPVLNFMQVNVNVTMEREE